MKKIKTFSALINQTFVHVRAYKKINAVARFKLMDSDIKSSDVYLIYANESHQPSVEDLFPEICK